MWRIQVLAVVVVALFLGGCASGQPEPSLEPGAGEGEVPALEAACGAVALPVVDPPVLPEEPLDEAAEAALADLARVGAEVALIGRYEWFVAERGDQRLVLFGRPWASTPPGAPGFADASFSRDGERWVPEGFGQCRIEVSAGGLGNAHWTVNPVIEPDRSSEELAIRMMERNCAGGQAPEGRQIIPVVEADAERVTITILVEPVPGGSDCPSNPWHPVVVDLGEPLGDRALFDGATIPALARVWPPTQASLDSLGSQP